MKKRLLLTVLAILCVVPSFGALTAADILSRVRTNIKDQQTQSTRQTFSDSTLLSYLSDGVREANDFAWLLQTNYSFTLTGGTTEYSLPSDFVATQRVLFKNVKLDATSLNQLDANSAGWKTVSGTPINYYIYYTTSPVIGFFPAPTTSSTGTVNVFYVEQPNELTATSQTILNGWPIFQPYYGYFADYVTYRCWMTLEETDLAQPYFQSWQNGLQMMKAGLNKQPDFNPGMEGRRNQ